MNLIEAIKQAMFPIGSLMAFKSGFTPPTGWQEIEDQGVPYENASPVGSVLSHAHNIEANFPTGDGQKNTYAGFGNALSFGWSKSHATGLKGSIDGPVHGFMTQTTGGSYNKPFGFEAKWYIWDPDKAYVYRYNKRLFYFQMRKCSVLQHTHTHTHTHTKN